MTSFRDGYGYHNFYYNQPWYGMYYPPNPSFSHSIEGIASNSNDPVAKAVANNIIQTNKFKDKPGKPKKIEELRCELCDITVHSQQVLITHFSGKSHKKKVKNQELLKKLREESSVKCPELSDKVVNGSEVQNELVELPIQHSGMKCDLCNLSVNSPQQMTIHLSGAKHKKMLKKKSECSKVAISSSDNELSKAEKVAVVENLPGSIIRIDDPSKRVAGTFKCKSCDCLLNSEHQVTQHIQSQKHQDMELGIASSAKQERRFNPYGGGRAKFRLKRDQTSNADTWKDKKVETSSLQPLQFVPSS